MVVLSAANAVRPIQTSASHPSTLRPCLPISYSYQAIGVKSDLRILRSASSLITPQICVRHTKLSIFMNTRRGSQFWMPALNLREYTIHYVQIIYQSPDRPESTAEGKVCGHQSSRTSLYALLLAFACLMDIPDTHEAFFILIESTIFSSGLHSLLHRVSTRYLKEKSNNQRESSILLVLSAFQNIELR